ncbi:fructose-like phosphotransferase system subunit EIIA [Escherichia coli]|uniref:Fructose-like phosphotransferase system subunit EIIA n=1 Tax=Escherichia coli TaxID=562 RepID=A0A376LFU5_ECOLX|nr:fructose-like phosphotransferase system subunit EIIA [Escherichia coli]
MAALTASCIDLNIQGNGAYSVLKQLATMALQNGFITDSTPVPANPAAARKNALHGIWFRCRRAAR